jgi:hypothetical protein
MAVEHEHKIILKDWETLHARLMEDKSRLVSIEQFYLDEHARYRRIHNHPISRRGYVEEYTFTYKRKIGDRLLEEEKESTKADYELARTAAVSSLFKHRFKYPGETRKHHWDIDFLMTARPEEGGRIYFAMAEIETPENARWRILPILEPYVELVVPREFSHLFTNARLTDQSYAAGAMDGYRAAIESNLLSNMSGG